MEGRIVAHDKHVLSMKDNNQSANLEALIDAGIRSFKIEGRYKDMGYVKNITAHYRTLLDALIERRPEFARASTGRTTFAFTPDPEQNFNREFTDYFVGGRRDDIGAFDTPKNPGLCHRLRQQGRRQVGRTANRLARHRAEQRRRPLLLHLAERARRAGDQPRGKGGRGRMAGVPEGPAGKLQGLARRHAGQPQPRHELEPHAGQAIQRAPHRRVAAAG